MKIARARCLSALALWAALAASGAAAQTAAAPLQLPADLIREVLDIDQSAGLRLAGAQPADTARTRFYIDNSVPGLLLLQITLQVDDSKPVRYTYGQSESLALQSQAVHRLAEVAATPGTHKLYAEYVARYPTDRPGTPRLRSRVVQNFEQPAGANAIEVSLVAQGWAREPALHVRQWTPSAGGIDDAELHSIDLLLATGHELRAASELLELQRHSAGNLPPDFGQRLNQALAALQSPGGYAPGNSAALQVYQSAAASGDVALLAQLGRDDKISSPEGLAMRDKANTALGYRLLQQQQAQAADAAFRLVRSPGPYAEMALLGLGWAQLTPDTGTTAPASAKKTSIASAPSPFNSSWVVADEKQADDLRRALVPWIELIGRDPTEAAVQEGLLAIPYALDHLGAHKQGQLYTQRAIDQLEHTRTHLEAALVHISNGRMAQLMVDREEAPGNGWDWWYSSLPEPRWWLTAPPNAPDNFYVERLMENDAFRTQLQTCHRLFELDHLLESRDQQLGDSDPALSARIRTLRPKLAGIAQSQRGQLARIATEQVLALKQQTEKYLVEAHFAMARFNDRPPNAIGNAHK